MLIEETATLQVPRSKVWAYLTDPASPLEFMEGVARWDVEGTKATGLGARYAVRMKVGTAFVGGIVEVVEYDVNRDLAWHSVTGIDQRGRFRLRSERAGETDVTFRLSFTVPGGILGRLSERIAGRAVRSNLRRSLERLRERLEPGPSGGG